MLKVCILAVGLLYAGTAAANPLNLTCDGYGTKNVPVGGSGVVHDNWGHSAQVDVDMSQRVQFQDQVTLEIDGNGTGRIRMPSELLPQFRFSNRNWMKLSDVAISDTEITANVRPGLLRALKQFEIRLDRIQGSIHIDGPGFNGDGHYSGKCRAFDPEVTKRQF